MNLHFPRRVAGALLAGSVATLLVACGSVPGGTGPVAARAAVAVSAAMPCADLGSRFSYAATRLTSVESVAADTLRLPGIAAAMPEHCVVKGVMNERVSTVDGKPYAIGFEMRLPRQWNGRFFYQANGGLDGFLTPAYGEILGGGPTSNGLLKGFAVLSSDAGHAFERNVPGIGAALFGRDPQARIDYGYNAVAQLTPMARALIASFYGKGPDTAYLVGTSNGGRHGMVAAARDTGRYDGIVVTTPGYRLPRAALAQVWGAQQFATVSAIDPRTQRPNLQTSFTPAELAWVAAKVLEQCDALDGLADGIVGDTMACQRRFNADAHLTQCAAGATGDCLSAAQKAVLARVFAGSPYYAGLPWDAGIRGNDWRTWKFDYSLGPRDAIAVAFVFSTPPMSPDVVSGQGNSLIDYALGFDFARDAGRVDAKDAVYTQSAMEFMTPPEPTLMRSFVSRGGKLLVAHGVSDPVFSALDTIAWYEGFSAQYGAKAQDSARLFLVPGMNHSRNGLATDQFDLVDEIVRWVEQGQAPDAVVARARGAGSPLANPEVPASWSANRTRLLCAYPKVARYRGAGDPESAASFACLP